MNNRDTNDKNRNKKEEENDKAPIQESINKKARKNAVSRPKLFNPPVIQDYEIKHAKSNKHSQPLKDTNDNREKESPVDEKQQEFPEISSYKKDWKQNQENMLEVESSVDEESIERFIAMLEESSSMDEPVTQDKPFHAESNFYNYVESSSFVGFSQEKEMSFFEESSSTQDESSSISVESSCFEESSSILEAALDSTFSEYESSSLEEDDPSKLEQNMLPIVKMPVLLTNVEIEIDIYDSFLLHLPIKEISNVNWSVFSLEAKVPLPSQQLFVKGILSADIEYIEDNENNSLQTVKMQVPFSTTTNVDWLTLPDVPSCQQAEYMYQEFESIQLHQEITQQYAHPIQSELKNVHIVWQNEVISENERLNVQGSVRLFVHLLQDQYIKLVD